MTENNNNESFRENENFRKKKITMSDKVRRKLLKRRIYIEDLEYIKDKGRVAKRKGRYIKLCVGDRRKPLIGIFWELETELDTRTAYRKGEKLIED